MWCPCKSLCFLHRYFGCGKCIQEGEYFNSVCFAERFLDQTDESFILRLQEEHHTRTSILETLNIDMVSQIPYKYIHLVCLGITRKLIRLWIKGNSVAYRLPSTTVNQISHHLISLREFIPKEFCQKPRMLCDRDRWKTTELQLFLLYSGLLVLKSLPTIYMFITWHCIFCYMDSLHARAKYSVF